ncbi:MAG: LamG-like jellyroll fold domain-containing protein [Planctomycetota bacterium]
MTKKYHKFSPAFTLVEVMLVVAVVSVIALGVTGLVYSSYQGWEVVSRRSTVLQDGHAAMDFMVRTLRQAKGFTAISDSSDSAGVITFTTVDDLTEQFKLNTGTDELEYGDPCSTLSALTGPVNSLIFTCYDIDDTALADPVEVADIRSINIQAEFANAEDPSLTFTLTGRVFVPTEVSSSCLVGRWKLDDGFGLTAVDSSGNGNDGTLTNMDGSEWTAGILAGALEFNAASDSDDQVFVSQDSSINDLDTLTLSAWVYLDSYGGSSWGRIIQKDDAFILLVNSSQIYKFGYDRWGTNAGAWQTDAGTIQTGQWYHLAVTYDSSSTANDPVFYIDGSSVNVNEQATPIGSKSSETSDLYIGNSLSADRCFDGTIDDFRIYNCVLDPCDIASLADALRYREFTEAKAATDTTSLTISTPGGSIEGDLLIAAVATDGDTSSTLAPPGGESWTEIDLDYYSSAVTLGAWWKNAEASESSSHQFTWTGDQQAYGWMMRFTGHDPTTPINFWAGDGESSSTPTSPEVVTTVDDTLILRMGAFDEDDITEDAPGLSGHTAITMDKSSEDMSNAGLVGWWKMDEQSGLTASDSSGNGNDGTLTNMAGNEWTTGQIGGALEFDSPGASDDIVAVNQHASINNLETFTLATWVYVNSHISYGRFFQKHPGAFIFCLGASADRNMVFTSDRWATRGFWRTNNGTIQAGQWYHVAVTYDYSSTANNPVFYIDGVSVNVNELETPSGSKGSDTSELRLGTQGPPYSQHLDGIVDDMRIYNRVLSGAEIAELAAGGGFGGSVSGGAGYVSQADAGSSGTSTFTLTASQEARTLTVGIAGAP